MAHSRRKSEAQSDYPFLSSSVMRAQDLRARRQFIKNLRSRRQSEQVKEAVEWIERNRWIDGAPWSFTSPGPKMEWGKHDVRSDMLHRPYLTQYLGDRTETKSAIKPRQAEMSENTINEILFLCATIPSFRSAHVFPVYRTARDFSLEKIHPAVNESPHIKNIVQRVTIDRITLKNSSLYSIAGALGRAAGRTGSRDLIAYDEYDFMPESVIGVFEQMLSHSKFRLQRFLSTPTVPGIGIDAKVKQGTSNQWIVTCPDCKKEQSFSFPDNLINFWDAGKSEIGTDSYFKKLHEVYIGCSHCGAYIDRNSEHYLNTSQWIAENPAMKDKHSSYYINVFMIAWKTGVEIARRAHLLQDYTWQFYNEVIGLAYIKGSSRLNPYDISRARRNWHMYKRRSGNLGRVSVGVDWGAKSSWLTVVSDQVDPKKPEMPCIIYAEEINDESLAANGISKDAAGIAHVIRVLQVAEVFDAMIIVNDANGMGIDRNKELLKQEPIKTWGAFFDTADATKQLRNTKLTLAKWEEASKRVTLSKLLAVKEMQNEIRHGGFGIPEMTAEDSHILVQLESHLQGLGIQPRWNLEQEREYEIVVKFGEDHLFDAAMYARLGFEKLAGLRRDSVPGVIAPG